MSKRSNESAREAINIAMTIALASMRASLHVFRLLANNGLVSPQDIDESSERIIADFEQLPEGMHRRFRDFVETTFADLKVVAAANWKGE